MSKTKKIILVLLAIILTLPCFIITISADSLGISINSISDFFELDDVQLKVALSDSPIDNAEGWQTITLDKGVTGMNWNCLTVGVSGDETHIKNNVWQIKCILKVKDKYIQKGFSSGSFYITVNDTNYSRYRIFEPTWTDGFKLLKLDSNCTYEGDVIYRSNQKIICNIPEETVPDTFNRVQVIFFITNKKTITSGELLYFNFSDLKLNMYNESDKLAYTITQNQNENTDKIIENQNSNAQTIIDNQNQLQENEKNEANSTGADGVDEIGSIIPNESQGFINSINNLVGVMSYNGTDCNWELPSVSLPKIDGVMPQIKLWDKLEIPFEFWIDKIPSNIMILVQSLLTIALIVYCFKELYSIISYVLTLKGGGSSE